MPAARRLAISYSRFSDPKQAKGDSEDRQADLFRKFCTHHNLTPLSEVFADRGRSGYKDEHRKKGRLGQLVALAKDERFEPGTVVVVEAWDRLGRLRPDKQTDLIAELLRTGVHIGICRLDDIFTEEDFGTHKWTTLAVFIQLAYQESKQKSERVADSWKRRHQRAREDGTLTGGRLPAWLECVNGQARLIPERAAVVKRIFKLAAEGNGHVRIIQALKDVPPFGEVKVNEGRSRSQFSGKWTKPYIALVLNDRRAVGEYEPGKRPGRKGDGQPIAGFFPAVVTEEEYQLARAGQEQRLGYDRKGRALMARESKYVNTFKGLLKHARDGEGFVLHNKGTAKVPQLVLINATGESGRDRTYTFPYGIFEEVILGLLREVKVSEVLPKKAEAPSKADVLRAKLKNIRQDIAQLQADLKEGYSKALAAVLRERGEEEERIALELQEELAKSVRPAEKAWKDFPTLAKMVKNGGDEARLRLRPVLRRVVEEAWLLIVRRGSYQLAAVQFFFAGGAVRHYLIMYQPAANRRPGGWSARSLADIADPASLDLRRRDHAARLEKVLLALPLE